MTRVLLIVLGIVVAVLAFVLNQVWMYWAAGAFLLAAVVTIATRMWQRYQEAVRFRREGGQSLQQHPELEELGITDVRAKRKPADAATESQTEETERTRAEEPGTAGGESTTTATSPPPDEPPPEASGEETAASDRQSTRSSATAYGAAVFQPYVQALQAATESHTACLLVQEDVMLTYRIEAAVSHSASVRTTGAFETDDALLTANMTQVAVTIQPVGQTGVEPAQLGYYDAPVPDLEQVALAPVPTPSAASTYFLVLDATDTHLDHPRTKKLITHFADLLGLLIESGTPPRAPAEASTGSEAEEQATAPRPRRDIIAEEIEEAQRTSSPLALALVHLNRAEELAQESETVIADTESALRTRLEQSAPRSRVERFGELTYGVFYNGDVADVEPWAERLQDELERAGDMLAGGVSIGVAMLRAEAQSPDQLREDATEALRMAYETGTCTIVE
jgi:GGDEF domain-containing protein